MSGDGGPEAGRHLHRARPAARVRGGRRRSRSHSRRSDDPRRDDGAARRRRDLGGGHHEADQGEAPAGRRGRHGGRHRLAARPVRDGGGGAAARPGRCRNGAGDAGRSQRPQRGEAINFKWP